MDTLDHKKHSDVSTGHEDHVVYHCHRCGWPFPNPHPSAKHRRAHKRVCGTIEGYEIDQSKSPVSDDEDEHTVGPEAEKTDAKEIASSGGVGKIINRSEDDVFSDAITEFSDGGSSPRPGDKSLEQKTIGDDLSTSQSKVVDETVDSTQQLNYPTSINQMSNSGATVNSKDQSEGVTLITDTNVEPASVGLSNSLQPVLIVKDETIDSTNELGGRGTEHGLVKAQEHSDMQHEVVKHEPSDLTGTFEVKGVANSAEINGSTRTRENINAATGVMEVSDLAEVDGCNDAIDVNALVEPLIEKEVFDLGRLNDAERFDPNDDTCVASIADQTTETVKEDVNCEDKEANTELLEGSSDTGLEAKLDSVIYSADVNSDTRDLEKSIEITPKEINSELPHGTQFKRNVKEVVSVGVAGTGSENLTESCMNKNSSTNDDPQATSEPVDAEEVSVELKHDGSAPLNSENSEIPTLSMLESSKVMLPTDDNAADISGKFSFFPVLDKPVPSPLNFQVLHESYANVDVESKSSQDEGDVKLTKEKDGIFTTKPDTPEGKGSVSADKLETHSQEPKTTTEKSDVFEPPSFMTLVDQIPAASEIETVCNDQQPRSDALQAGWFPSLTNVVNESEGRKKNEEKIAKVTSWSPGKQHGSLKNLLSEAKSPNSKQIPATYEKDEDALKYNGADVTKVNSALEGKEMDKEWDSPARYPIETKKEKKKTGKPFWLPFACCSSVHRDL